MCQRCGQLRHQRLLPRRSSLRIRARLRNLAPSSAKRTDTTASRISTPKSRTSTCSATTLSRSMPTAWWSRPSRSVGPINDRASSTPSPDGCSQASRGPAASTGIEPGPGHLIETQRWIDKVGCHGDALLFCSVAASEYANDPEPRRFTIGILLIPEVFADLTSAEVYALLVVDFENGSDHGSADSVCPVPRQRPRLVGSAPGSLAGGGRPRWARHRECLPGIPERPGRLRRVHLRVS